MSARRSSVRAKEGAGAGTLYAPATALSRRFIAGLEYPAIATPVDIIVPLGVIA